MNLRNPHFVEDLYQDKKRLEAEVARLRAALRSICDDASAPMIEDARAIALRAVERKVAA